MDESLKEARSTYRAFVYLCGLYLLALLCVMVKGGENATISFWGIPLPGVGMLTFVVALGFVFLNLKLAAQLNHIRLILPFGEDEYRSVKHSPWELLSRGWRLSTCVKYVEFLVIFLAFGLLTGFINDANRLVAVCYCLVNLGIFYYSTIQLWLFRIDLRSYEQINGITGDSRFYDPDYNSAVEHHHEEGLSMNDDFIESESDRTITCEIRIKRDTLSGAFHEAGHAMIVTKWSYPGRVIEVSKSTSGQLYTLTLPEPPDTANESVIKALGAKDIEWLATMLMAGIAAERIHKRRNPRDPLSSLELMQKGENGDLYRLKEMATHLDKNADDMMWAYIEKAYRILTNDKKLLVKMAAVIESQSVTKGEELYALCSD